MKEIAIRAGISRPNVSKILNNKPVMVSTGTREKVLQIARELNYTPNYFARTLKTGKTNCIGVSILTNGRDFFTRFNDNYLSNVYSGLGAAIKANAIKMLFHEVNEHKESMELANKRMVTSSKPNTKTVSPVIAHQWRQLKKGRWLTGGRLGLDCEKRLDFPSISSYFPSLILLSRRLPAVLDEG